MRAKSERYEYHKNNYEYCKKHHICVRCHTEKAFNNSFMCLECKFKSREQSLKTYYKHKTEYIHKKNMYNKKKRELLRAFGVCTICKKRDAEENIALCKYCLFKGRIKNKKQREKKGVMPRDLMGKGKYCYICGAEVVNSEKLCSKCKDRCSILIKRNGYEYLHGNNNRFREFEKLRHAELISKNNWLLKSGVIYF